MELNTQMRQNVTLSAHMQQCLGILMMDNAQLGEFIEEQSMENPILELADRVTWLNTSSSVIHIEREWTEEEENENEIAAEETPKSDLYFQLSEYHLPLAVRRAAEYIIESLDERGYFTENVRESAKVLKTDVMTVKEALKTVRQLEPKGVGTGNLKECLLMQIESEYPREKVAREIIENYLDDYSKGKYGKIGKKSGKDEAEIRHAGEIIRRLNPRPLVNMKPTVRTRYITADLALVMYEDHYDIVLNDVCLPEIHYNYTYLDMLKKEIDEPTKQYICEHYEKARWLKYCVERRQETLLLAAQMIFKNQKEFLMSGPTGICPLTFKKIADDMHMNVSTVSRAIKGKYIQTKWGIYPLRSFFGNGVRTEEGEMSPAQIRLIIKRMIEKEDRGHPLSDSKIEKMLKEKGVSISRRTVAGYREQMNISSSTVRRAEYI